MTQDIDIKINGLSEIDAQEVVKSLIELLKKFNFLDLRRFKSIIICDDVNKEISMLLGEENKFLANRYNTNSDLYAKVITLIDSDNIDIVLVVNNSYVLNLIKKSHCTQDYKNALHVFHHELSHVHDFNNKIDIFKKDMLTEHYKGIDEITYPIAEICWSEYIANFMSSSSTTKSSFPKTMANSLADLVSITNQSVSTNLMVFKVNKNRIDIIEDIIFQVEKVCKTASYLLGYMHGLNISLEEISDEALFQVEKSNFRRTWEDMSYELTSIRNVYPLGWEKINIYENLSRCIFNYFIEFGILFTQDEKGDLFISVK